VISGLGDAPWGKHIGEGIGLSPRPQYSVLPLGWDYYYYFQRRSSITGAGRLSFFGRFFVQPQLHRVTVVLSLPRVKKQR
jgi:hypothetical protein